MLHCNLVIMPMLNTAKFSTNMKLKEINATFYRTIVGKFIFLTNIRPNITFVLGVVSRYMVRPQKPHFEATKHVVKYINATTDFGIFYHREGDGVINNFTNANWARDKDQ